MTTTIPQPTAPPTVAPAMPLPTESAPAPMPPPAPAPTPAAAPPPPAVKKYRYDAFPDFPPRGDMQNTLYLHDQGHQAALRRHFGAPQNTVVIGEVPVAWNRDQREGFLVPDLLIVFDVARPDVLLEMGYSIEHHGKPPDFVLELASKHTSRRDETRKRSAYAAFGAREYWRFDPVWGGYYIVGLAGDTLVNGVYQPIPIRRTDENRHWGHSVVLNLDLCWEHGELRFYDPATQQYLHTFDSADDTRIAAEYARDAAIADRNREAAARQAAEERIRQLEARLAASES